MAPPSSNEWKVMALYTEYVIFFAHYTIERGKEQTQMRSILGCAIYGGVCKKALHTFAPSPRNSLRIK